MSADNWRVCPNCKRNADKEREKFAKELEDAYGKISREDYLNLSTKMPSEVDHTSLREDFAIGISENGEFFVSYRGGCDVCGFVYQYSFEEKALK